MADDQTNLPDDFGKSFEALAHPGEPNEKSPITGWRSLVHDAIRYLLSTVNQLETHLKRLDQSVEISHKVIEVVIAKLEPGPDDVVIFWLPAELTRSQVRGVYDDFSAVIGARFKFLVLIRQSVDIEIITGKASKGGVLLPS